MRTYSLGLSNAVENIATTIRNVARSPLTYTSPEASPINMQAKDSAMKNLNQVNRISRSKRQLILALISLTTLSSAIFLPDVIGVHLPELHKGVLIGVTLSIQTYLALSAPKEASK